MKKILFLLLVSIYSYSQEYSYDNCFLRDDFGKFKPLNKGGEFKIQRDSVYLFEQRLKIRSHRTIFNGKQESSGRLYTCVDSSYVYTFLLTPTNELYFYTKDKEMIKFILKPSKS